MSGSMLQLLGVHGGYGRKRVLHGIDLAVGAGEVVAMMGRNGVGKTTTIRTIMGFNPASEGRVMFGGVDVTRWPAHRIAQAGIGLVPEGRQIFNTLTVRENLLATARERRPDGAGAASAASWTMDRIQALFPRLAERSANWGWQLSGGEQQMLAIGRALMTNPRLLILDEATEGIAPLMRREIWNCLRQVSSQGQAILVVDKNLEELSSLAHRYVMVEKGMTVWSGSREQMQASPDVYERYLGV